MALDVWTVTLDGVDITQKALVFQWTRRSSRPCQANIKVQTNSIPAFALGVSVLAVQQNGTDVFNGRLWEQQDSGDANTVYTELTAYDSMITWNRKIARDADGDFSKPDFFENFPDAPGMMEYVLNNSVTYEGWLDMIIGTVATGGPDLQAQPADFPMSIDELRQLLLQTGYLDIIVNPSGDPDDINTVNLYNGDYGTDRSADIALEFGIGALNVKEFKQTWSMKDVCNKLWYYLGPKCDQQHWRGNITGDDPTLAYPPGGDVDVVDPDNPLGQLRRDSRDQYGELMEIRIYDDFGGDCIDDAFGTNNDFRPFYQRMWQNESLLRAFPRNLIRWTPVRGYYPDAPFDVLDIVSVQAGALVGNGGVSGTMRVYEFTVDVDPSGAGQMTNIITSHDGDQL